MKYGLFGVAVAPSGLGVSPNVSKWSQDPKNVLFGVSGSLLGVKRVYLLVKQSDYRLP